VPVVYLCALSVPTRCGCSGYLLGMSIRLVLLLVRFYRAWLVAMLRLLVVRLLVGTLWVLRLFRGIDAIVLMHLFGLLLMLSPNHQHV
jgi:hypothetical protein